MNQPPRTIQLKPESALVEEVFLLAERFREAVDYSARGSFVRAAAGGMLWAAVGEGPGEGRLLGYLLVHPTRDFALIHQVLVAEEERGQGIGTRLVEAAGAWAAEQGLDVATLSLYSQRGSSREKVPGCWLRWGFAPVPGTEALTYAGARFQLLLRDSAPELFTAPEAPGLALEGGGASTMAAGGGLPALLDPDLFEELAQCPALEAETELRVLASARFRRELEVQLPAETAEELARGHSRDPRGRTAAAREKRVQALAWFRRLEGGGLDLENWRARVTRVLQQGTEPGADGKIPALPAEDLAYCAARGVPLFLTLNDYLLEREDAIYRGLGVSVLTPTAALANLPTLQRERDYSPIRLSAECLRTQLLPEELPAALVERFLSAESGETRETFLGKLARFTEGAHPDACRRVLIGPPAGEPAPAALEGEAPPPVEGLGTLLVLLRTTREILRIPLWRLPAHPLRATFARQVLAGLVQDALGEGRKLVLVQDGFLHAEMREALVECGFLPCGTDSWARTLIPGSRRARAWMEELRDLPGLDPIISAAVARLQNWLAPKANGIPKEDYIALERHLAPGRVQGAELPSYLAEMKPGWAMRVLDKELAEIDLFEGTRRSELRPRELVQFYPAGSEAAAALPGRVLWHVCARANSGYVRAVSNLVAVETGTVAEMYRKYRRLGYFTEKEVQALAGGSGRGRASAAAAEEAWVCAWLLTETWLLPRALPWAEALSILEEAENRTQFGAVTRLSTESFQLLHAAAYTPIPPEENLDHLLVWD